LNLDGELPVASVWHVSLAAGQGILVLLTFHLVEKRLSNPWRNRILRWIGILCVVFVVSVAILAATLEWQDLKKIITEGGESLDLDVAASPSADNAGPNSALLLPFHFLRYIAAFAILPVLGTVLLSAVVHNGNAFLVAWLEWKQFEQYAFAKRNILKSLQESTLKLKRLEAGWDDQIKRHAWDKLQKTVLPPMRRLAELEPDRLTVIIKNGDTFVAYQDKSEFKNMNIVEAMAKLKTVNWKWLECMYDTFKEQRG
jgi:hypothetical protein